MPEMISIGMAERFARRSRKASLRRARRSALVPTTRTPSACTSSQPLAEALEAGQRARGHVLVEPPVVFEPGAEAHHFAQAIE